MKNLLASFVELVHLRSEMNKLFEALQDLEGHHEESNLGFAPPYDILETPEAVMVQVDLPGVSPASLQVTVQGGLVTMQGERDRSHLSGIVAYHLMERDRGPFIRRFRVEGAINTHQGSASYDNGVLTLRFPRVPDRRGSSSVIPIELKG
jgi:HSP20 family protein